MKKSDQTTPIINILSQNTSDPRHQRYVLEFISLRPNNISSLQLNKNKLGKQKYCIFSGFARYWVWEGKNWRALISRSGLSFEVLPNLSLDEAWRAWEEYRDLLTK